MVKLRKRHRLLPFPPALPEMLKEGFFGLLRHLPKASANFTREMGAGGEEVRKLKYKPQGFIEFP